MKNTKSKGTRILESFKNAGIKLRFNLKSSMKYNEGKKKDEEIVIFDIRHKNSDTDIHLALNRSDDNQAAYVFNDWDDKKVSATADNCGEAIKFVKEILENAEKITG